METPVPPPLLPPSKRTLTLQSAPELDQGRVAVAFNNALRLATLDIVDRPADKTARKVFLICEMRPVLDKDTAVLDVIDNQFVVKKAFPVQRSAPYPMTATTDGQMVFDVGSPLDPRQNTFDFRPPEEEGASETVDPETGEVIDKDEEEGTM